MARIIPFRGILYNPEKIYNLADVVTQPFDIISPKEQQDAYERHPESIIRLILGKTTEKDTISDNPHTRAAKCFSEWRSNKILIQDKIPSLYFTSMRFSIENSSVTRYGLIALVGLEPFEKGIVIPHERTFSKVKSERLQLMKACHANFSPIFSMYSDNNILDSLKSSALHKSPDIDFTDYNNQQHKLWRITDEEVHRYISDTIKGKKIFIADGHHRYETALNYRDWLKRNTPDFNDDHPANYVMMYLSSMEDPGLIILPAHRMLKQIPENIKTTLVRKASGYFDIIKISFSENGHENALTEFTSILKSNDSKNTIGVFMKGHNEFHLLTLKPKVMEKMFGKELSESLRTMDVTVLTRLVFMEILGFDQSRLDNEKLIAYSSSEKQAMETVFAGECDLAFILNPTKIEQVKRIAEEGLVMPRKATYFYPKVITGMVINKLTIDD